MATELVPRVFKRLIHEESWLLRNNLPQEEEWEESALKSLIMVRRCLEMVANHRNFELSSLACTAIVVLFSTQGILVTHIGDGRAAYCNGEDEWNALITPFKAEEASSTVFITSDITWDSNSPHIQSKVIDDTVQAFALMSDGCRNAAFEHSQMDEYGNWSDPNRPHSAFFDPLVEHLQQAANDLPVDATIQLQWQQFLEAGNETLAAEVDDKSMILGVCRAKI